MGGIFLGQSARTLVVKRSCEYCETDIFPRDNPECTGCGAVVRPPPVPGLSRAQIDSHVTPIRRPSDYSFVAGALFGGMLLGDD